MVEIAPLHGIRFDSARSGPIGPLIAPPYDVVNAGVTGAEFSISAVENVDLGQPGDQHMHAARTYARWLTSGVLSRDDKPSVYVHRHWFQVDGLPVVRTGLMTRVRLRDWDERVVLPHEATVPAPKEERLKRLRAVRANLSPLYLLYRDPETEIRDLLDIQIRDNFDVGQSDRMGGIHHLEAISDQAVLARLAAAFGERTLFVADGHHRYEAALLYRDEQRRLLPGVDGPWEFVLALLSAVEDPGVRVRPTHRVISGGPRLPAEVTLRTLGRWFDLRPRDSPGEEAEPEPLFGVALAGSQTLWEIRARAGEPHQQLLPPEHGRAWRSLAVSAVEAAVLQLNGHGEMAVERSVLPVVDEDDALRRVRDGLADAAFLLPVPSVNQLLEVAEQGDLLPPKSSWFEPKAPAGLVINDHQCSAP